MKLIKRALESTILDISKQFPVVMLTGARQVGKTTLLKMLDHSRRFITLDDPIVRKLAVSDPALFLQAYQPPVIIDEFQYAPQLLEHIKLTVDARPEEMGLYWLTGSQQFQLMKNVGESLAGRVGILSLGGIVQSEELSRKSLDKADDAMAIFQRIQRGSYPALVSGRVKDVQVFYGSYVKTYIERDVREITKIADELQFLQFLKVIAARTANLLNLSEVARDVGISQPTARAWLSILESCGLVYLLRPYSANITSRIVKTPKVYFMDTGLCSYLTGWTSAQTLASGAMSGAMLETFVVSEIIRKFWNSGREAPVWFYRDKAGTEIDLLVEQDGVLNPIEIKKSASPSLKDVKAFAKVASEGVKLGNGTLVCLVESPVLLSRNIQVLPVGRL